VTEKQEKVAIAAGILGTGLLVWWYWPRAPAVVRLNKSELVIDDNVMSPTFGLPVYGPPAPSARADGALNPDMRRLIDASNAAIAADDKADKG